MTDIRVRRLPRQPGPAGWNALLPQRTPRPPLTGAETADVAVIGAGFAGLSAARHLSLLDPELRVAVLEAGEVGDGPAGRNSGFMIDLPHDLASDDYAGEGPDKDRRQIAQNRIAIEFARLFASEKQLPTEVFNPCGKVNAAATDSGDRHNAEFGAYLARLDEPSTLLDAQAMQELTGTSFYTSGLLTPGGVMIQPAAYVRALADSFPAQVSLHERSPVVRMQRRGGEWVVSTPKGRVTAACVILATNGHAESFGFFSHRLMHIFTYASMTRVLDANEVRRLGGAPHWAVTPADPMGTSVRRINGTGGDRIVVRARFTYAPSMEVSERRIKAVGRMHDRKFRDRFPMLEGIDMEHRWAGHLCLSWNAVPAFEEVEQRVFSACCCNGLGTVKSTLMGMAAAECAIDRPGTAASCYTGLEPPRRLPPEPLAWVGANAVMRWREARAGKE